MSVPKHQNGFLTSSLLLSWKCHGMFWWTPRPCGHSIHWEVITLGYMGVENQNGRKLSHISFHGILATEGQQLRSKSTCRAWLHCGGHRTWRVVAESTTSSFLTSYHSHLEYQVPCFELALVFFSLLYCFLMNWQLKVSSKAVSYAFLL